jgi:glucose-1-phosphate thymidylyltransferase
LLPVYDKPLVYYALSILMLAGIRRIALVTSPRGAIAFKRLLGGGRQFGVEIDYLIEESPGGPARSLVLARDFIGPHNVALILADCLLYGDGLQRVLTEATHRAHGATAFAHPVGNPERHAIVELAGDGAPQSIEVRPLAARSNLALTDMYFFDADVVDMAGRLAGTRGDALGMTDILGAYLSHGRLHVTQFGRGFAWLDTTTHAALSAAANFIETIESTHGLKIGCLEEIAYRKGYVSAGQVSKSASELNNAYGAYLRNLLAPNRH